MQYNDYDLHHYLGSILGALTDLGVNLKFSIFTLNVSDYIEDEKDNAAKRGTKNHKDAKSFWRRKDNVKGKTESKKMIDYADKS